jgi:hypothetical protein
MEILNKNHLSVQFRYVFIWLWLYGFLFGILHYIFNSVLFDYKPNEILQKIPFDSSIIDNPFFWNSPVGICIRIIIEIFTTSIFVWVGVYISNLKMTFRQILYAILVSHIIFFIEYLTEFSYLLLNRNTIIHLDNFAFGSISYFLKKWNIPFDNSLNYLFETLSIFEIIYWLSISYVICILSNERFSRIFKIVFLSYILPLLFWSAIICFMSIMYIH